MPLAPVYICPVQPACLSAVKIKSLVCLPKLQASDCFFVVGWAVCPYSIALQVIVLKIRVGKKGYS